MWIIWGLTAVVLVMIGYDLTQRKHAILRNFPVIGHFRYWLEALGPELRQYIVTDNDEERPFSRDQRRWVYSSSKAGSTTFGFGSDNDMELSPHYLIVKHAAFPLPSPAPGDADHDPRFTVPCLKTMGGARARAKAFRPASIVNISGMSFGSLSGPAVEALNRGAALAECLHNTGEGGVSAHHQHGGELVWQIGTAYFGCRDANGRFSMDAFKEIVARNPAIRAVELKLSQGAKPGLGGLLPKAKITREIAAVRGIPMGHDCVSPARHSAFHDADSLLDFVELLAAESGLPVGIKSAVGESTFWEDLARLMSQGDRGLDFVAVDGGEGGTGAAPLVYTDHVALPFKIGFSRVHRIFAEAGITDRVIFIGSGKLGFPESGLLALALGCDMLNIGREGLLAIGCIQAQRCHNNHCPTGVTTQNRWLTRGLDPQLKSVRVANYVVQLRRDLLRLARSCGVPHPGQVAATQLELLDDRFGARTVADVFGGQSRGALVQPAID